MDAHANRSTGCNILMSCRDRKRGRDMTQRRTSFTARRGRTNAMFNPSRWGCKLSPKYMFSGLDCTFTLFPSRHRAASFRRFSQHQWSVGRCGFPVALFSFLPRGSEGLANHLSAPVGRVDSTSTTGPVFRSDESKADLATLKAGG